MNADTPSVASFDAINVRRLAGSLAKSVRLPSLRGQPALTALGLLETGQRGGTRRRAMAFFRIKNDLIEVGGDGAAPIDLGETDTGFILGTALPAETVPPKTIRASLAKSGIEPPSLKQRGAFVAHLLVGSFPGTPLDSAGRTSPAWVTFYGNGRSTVMAIHSATTAQLLQLVTLPASSFPNRINLALGWGFLLKLLLLAAAVLALALLISAIASNPGLLVLGYAAKWAVLLLVLVIIAHILDILLEINQANAAANQQRINRIKAAINRIKQLQQRAKQNRNAGQPAPKPQDIDDAQSALDEAKDLFDESDDDMDDDEKKKFEDAFDEAKKALDKLR